MRRPVNLLWLSVSLSLIVAAAIATAVALRDQPAGLRLSVQQRAVIDNLESVLLHDTEVAQYGRMVNQFDARGYVAGIADFTTADGGVLEVVDAYGSRVGPNPLTQDYRAALIDRARGGSGALDGLDGLPDAWRQASADPRFRDAQDATLQRRYFEPALSHADALGLTTPLGFVIIYDALLQHGAGEDPDGLPALIAMTDTAAEGRPGVVPERDWLAAFLDERLATVLDPSEPDHRQAWLHSEGRVRALMTLLAAGMDHLAPPLAVSPYGTRHVIDGRSPTEQYAAGALPSLNSTAASPAPGSATSPGPPGPASTTTPPASRTTSPRPSATTPAPTTPAPQPSGVTISPTSGAVIRLVNVATGMSMAVAGGSSDNGAPIVLSRGTGTAAQWRIVASSGGCYHLVNVRSAAALDVPEGSPSNGVQMQQWKLEQNSPNQTWCFQNVGADRFSLQNRSSHNLLDGRDGVAAEGTAVQQWGAMASEPNLNQTWRLFLVP